MKRLSIHPLTPQNRLIQQTARLLEEGAIAAIPTDSCYALVTLLGNHENMRRIRLIRDLDQDRLFTLLCQDLSNLSVYAKVSNFAFRLIKKCTPGAYTFILPASSKVPKNHLENKRKEIGLRIPDHSTTQMLLQQLNAPLLSVSIRLDEHYHELSEADAIEQEIGHAIDVLLDCGNCGTQETTIIQFDKDIPSIIRQGKGAVPWN